MKNESPNLEVLNRGGGWDDLPRFTCRFEGWILPTLGRRGVLPAASTQLLAPSGPGTACTAGRKWGRGAETQQGSASSRGSLHSMIMWEIKACSQGANSRQLFLASVGSAEVSTEAFCRSAFLSAQSYFLPVPSTSVT